MTNAKTERLFSISIASALAALVALFVFILPAEYDLDPTGVGEALGIKGMAGYSVAALSKQPGAFHGDQISFPLAPFESIEYKYLLNQGQSMVFSWRAISASNDPDAELIFDMHSEEEGKKPEDSISFDIGRGTQANGSFVAPFNGIHGWYWENRTAEEIVVELQTTGFYSKATTYGPNGAFSKAFPLEKGISVTRQ
jgi:hypothetical protein